MRQASTLLARHRELNSSMALLWVAVPSSVLIAVTASGLKQLLASNLARHTGYGDTIKELQITLVGNVAATDHKSIT